MSLSFSSSSVTVVVSPQDGCLPEDAPRSFTGPGRLAFHDQPSRAGRRGRRPGVPADPDTLNKKQRKARDWLLERGQKPTLEAITGALRDQAAAHQKLTRKRRAQQAIGPAVRHSGPAAALCVSMYLEHHGTGPRWGELARQFGWSRASANVIIRELAERGWLTYTDEPRSLRPGPNYDPSVVTR